MTFSLVLPSSLLKFPTRLTQELNTAHGCFLVQVNGTHDSEDEPPDLPFLTGSSRSKKCKDKPSSSSNRESVQSTDSAESKVHKTIKIQLPMLLILCTLTCFIGLSRSSAFFVFVDANMKHHSTTVERPESFD